MTHLCTDHDQACNYDKQCSIRDAKFWNHHDDIIKWKLFLRYWPFVCGFHWSPVNSPHKGQWCRALLFSLICALNKQLSKQSWSWWFEMPSHSLWRKRILWYSLAWCNASHLTNGSTVFIWKLYCYWPKDLHQHNATLDIQTNALQLKLSQVAMNKFSKIHLNDAVFPTCYLRYKSCI